MQKRLREVLGPLPDNVAYVPIDFARQDLAEMLNRNGYVAGKA